MSRSAWVPVKTGMSIGMRRMNGLFRRTPKFLSPLSSSRMNTPMCMRPTRAAEEKVFNNDPRLLALNTHELYLIFPHTACRAALTHTGLLGHRSGRRGWEPACPTHHCSSAQRRGISTKTHKVQLLTPPHKKKQNYWSFCLSFQNMNIVHSVTVFLHFNDVHINPTVLFYIKYKSGFNTIRSSSSTPC